MKINYRWWRLVLEANWSNMYVFAVLYKINIHLPNWTFTFEKVFCSMHLWLEHRVWYSWFCSSQRGSAVLQFISHFEIELPTDEAIKFMKRSGILYKADIQTRRPCLPRAMMIWFFSSIDSSRWLTESRSTIHTYQEHGGTPTRTQAHTYTNDIRTDHTHAHTYISQDHVNVTFQGTFGGTLTVRTTGK